MIASYEKPWLSFDEQLNKLVERGLVVENRDKAINKLKHIGYYRLSGYWFPLRQRSDLVCLLENNKNKPKKPRVETLPLDAFKQGASFQNVLDLYVFDKTLRILVLDAIERIEIALRAAISYHLGKKDKFAYLEPKYFHSSFSEISNKTGVSLHYDWLGNHARLINRSKENFVKHNKDKYGLPLAIWVACEVWDFGCLSKLYAGMQGEDQDAISKQYGIANGRIFASWLRALNYLRNVCAHHSRLWNRNMVDQPKTASLDETPWASQVEDKSRCFYMLLIVRQLLGYINPTSTWSERVENLLANDFPEVEHLGLGLHSMGAPESRQKI